MRNVVCAALIALMPLNGVAQEVEQQPLSQEEIDAAQDLGISQDELFQVRNPMSREEQERVKRDIAASAEHLDQLAVKTDRALGIMVKRAAWVLEKKGYETDARQLTAEYDQFYSNAVYYTYLDVVPVELGDHQPLNQWLADWYEKISDKLGCGQGGIDLCKVLHLIDIKILNYGIPVVFHPAGYKGETWDLQDYVYHFAGHPDSGLSFIYHGVVGVISYWVSWGVCVGATFGAGAIGLICSPIATVVEIGMDKYVAPPLGEKVYCRANEGAAGCD